MKRFYKQAQAAITDDGFGVLLDSRPLITPAKNRLTVEIESLAESIAAEWSAQGEEIRREAMPMTRLVCAAIDIMPNNRSDILAQTVKYAETDLLCYRADTPAALAERQHEAWQPLVDWAARRFAAPVHVTNTVTAVSQDPALLANIGEAVDELSDLTATVLHYATQTSGSIFIAMALWENEIDAETAWAASQVDETFQIERWGEDEELSHMRAGLRRDLADAARLMRHCRQSTA